MRKTYAYSGIIFGFLLGLAAYAKTMNIVIGILVGIGVSIVAFIIIRVLENALHKGAENLGKKAENAYQERKERKMAQRENYGQGGYAQQPAQFPARSDRQPTQFPARGAQPPAPHNCPYCGQTLKENSVFCSHCGSKVG